MKTKFLVVLLFPVTSIYAQNKYDHVLYNDLMDVKGTEYVIGKVDNWGKASRNSQHLAFINTRNGEVYKVNFPTDAYIEKVQQIKNDSLGINKVVISAKTIDLDGKNSIDWNDPKQIFLLSPDGREKKQITADDFFISTWIINNETGRIVITGHVDSNANGKHDNRDKNQILVYDIKDLKLVSTL